MLTYPNIDPVAFAAGPFAIRWYGVTYLLGFIGFFLLSWYRGRGTKWNPQKLADILFYAVIGIIIGGRVGYVLFYYPQDILSDPFTLLAFWEPGRSFHGGMLGVFVAMFIYSKCRWWDFIELTDFIAPAVPIGLGFGRLGNFINGELYGRITDGPWGMVFPFVGPQPRHPSQLYEFLLEGVVLCLWLVWYARKPRKVGAVSGMFLIGYGLMRSIVEFAREPDLSHGFVFGNLMTMGQLLSLPMVFLGIYFLCRRT